MISVCMATYNGERYIKQQIDSILCQLNQEDELIISDDMSTDKTLDIVREYNEPRIKIYLHDKDHGFVKNFENALLYAKGDYIFLSDQDDLWMPNKVEKTLEYLKQNDFVVSDCLTINDRGEIISQSRIKDFSIKTGFIRLMIKTRYLGCCMAFNKNVLSAILPFPNNGYLIEHDLWIASVAECYFKTSLINEPLICYRRHGSNTSSGGNDKGYSLSIKAYRRLYRLQCLYKLRGTIKRIKNKDKLN